MTDSRPRRHRADPASGHGGDGLAAADRHADRLVAGAHPLVAEGAGRRAGGAAAGAAADGAGLLSAAGDGPERPGRPVHAGARPRPPAVHLLGPGGRLGVLLAALRRAADPERLRGHRRAPAGSGGHAARRPAGIASSRVALPLARPGFVTADDPRLCAHRRRVRRRADDRRQHSRTRRAWSRCRSTTMSRRWSTPRRTGSRPAWWCSASSCCWRCTPSTRPGAGHDRARHAAASRPASRWPLPASRWMSIWHCPAAASRRCSAPPARARRRCCAASPASSAQPRGRLTVNGTRLAGRARSSCPPTAAPLGYVFQEASLFSHLSVRGNLDYGMKRVPRRMRARAARPRRSTCSASAPCSSARRPPCRAANASASPSPARWRSARNCC